ncbi:class I SAM-dependent RNA methyltransferase [Rothia sp. P7181]|uniref:class I SAM-dependent RNA methyltransferase n=1 Tax=Rothia sp. P7181 TaxID=3402663 RepID=UPI003AE66DD1
MSTVDFHVGAIFRVRPERVAHGGFFVARHHGRVIFVRHGVVGEEATVRITGIGPKERFFFADVIAVESPAPARRDGVWEPADALVAAQEGRLPVGGMEYAHLLPAVQREYKREIVREQLIRLGAMDAQNPVLESLIVQELPGGEYGTRTRIHYSVTEQGRIGMSPYRSAEVVAVQGCPLEDAAMGQLRLHELEIPDVARVDVAVSSTDERTVHFTLRDGVSVASVKDDLLAQCQMLWSDLSGVKPSILCSAVNRSGGPSQPVILYGQETLHESFELSGRTYKWEVSSRGFWQNHRWAAQTLGAAVLEALPSSLKGGTIYDIYAGAGLFTALAADVVGAKGTVLSVEGSAITHKNARYNFAVPDGFSRTDRSAKTHIEVRRGDARKVLESTVRQVKAGEFKAPDVVILDPSREGAGRGVIRQIDILAPARVIYIACDPASLGRDTGYLRALGWQMVQLSAFDMYPNTHHVESIAVFEKAHKGE